MNDLPYYELQLENFFKMRKRLEKTKTFHRGKPENWGQVKNKPGKNSPDFLPR